TFSGATNVISVGPSATNQDFIASYTTYDAPAIATQPAGQSVNPGSTVTFSVVATGTAPLRYQWRLNGGSISGALSSSYTKTNVQSADAGNYSVVVSNLFGTAASADAVLAINTPPAITAPPQNQTVVCGSNVTF